MRSLTQELIYKYPLKDHTSIIEIVKWIDSVVPSGEHGYEQSKDVTDAVIAHLRSKGVKDDAIGSALDMTGYRWTVSLFSREDTILRDAWLRRANEDIQMARKLEKSQGASRGHQRAGPPSVRDIARIRQLVEAWEVHYKAHPHNPKEQARALNAIISLISRESLTKDQALSSAISEMGGAIDDMHKHRDEIVALQEDILKNNAPAVRQIIRNMGPLALHRLTRSHEPGGMVRPPTTRLNPRAR